MGSKTEPKGVKIRITFRDGLPRGRSDPPGIDFRQILDHFGRFFGKSAPLCSRCQGFFANVHPSAAVVKVWVPLGSQHPKKRMQKQVTSAAAKASKRMQKQRQKHANASKRTQTQANASKRKQSATARKRTQKQAKGPVGHKTRRSKKRGRSRCQGFGAVRGKSMPKTCKNMQK